MHEPELRLCRPDGEWRVLCASTAPLGRDGRVQGAVVVYQDVTAKTPKRETGQGTDASLQGMPRRDGGVIFTEDQSPRSAPKAFLLVRLRARQAQRPRRRNHHATTPGTLAGIAGRDLERAVRSLDPHDIALR